MAVFGPTSVTQCDITGLKIGMEYSVTVSATNSYSEGEKAKAVTGRFLAVPS